jgi:hypothetical protein
MRIKQVYGNLKRMGRFMSFFDTYGLKFYNSKTEPAIFFGLYGKSDVKILRKHKGLAVLIWRGTDITKPGRLQQVKTMKNNVRHVSISYFIDNDLKKAHVPHKFLPIPGSNISNINPEPLGNEIYVYLSYKRHKFYGGHIVDKISGDIPFKINIVKSNAGYSHEEILDIYKRCFLGLRLTEHDGIANQVIEMGLMGRCCVHNGNHPNAIKWNNAKDVIGIINKQSKRIGQIDSLMHDKVKKYLNIGEKWLQTEFWGQT